MEIYYQKDVEPGAIDGKKVAILGYGSQGHAHALNLRDSGIDVRVGLREGSNSKAKAQEEGLAVTDMATAAKEADIVMMLCPDTEQKKIYEEQIAENMKHGDTLLFAHGFNIHFNCITPDPSLDVGMIAPKGPGHLVRRTFVEGGGVPALVAVGQDATGSAKQKVLAYGAGIGAGIGGMLESTFKEECETDLFGEQVVLCGGLVALVQNSFETLVAAGYQPEVAYFECLHELKLIADLMYEQGIGGMLYSISDTAEYGALTRGDRIVDDKTRKSMEKILAEIQSGDFAKEWIAESDGGRKNFEKMEAAQAKHQIEEVGEKLRKMMPWISEGKKSVQESSGG